MLIGESIEILPFFKIAIQNFAKEGLMIVFFAYIAMELRYEFHDGVLSDKRQVILPCMAAFGGILLPILHFLKKEKNPFLYSNGLITYPIDLRMETQIYKYTERFTKDDINKQRQILMKIIKKLLLS